MGRPSIRWEYKGDKIGEYAEDVDDVLVINVDDTTTCLLYTSRCV